jgi:hypothetical protein
MKTNFCVALVMLTLLLSSCSGINRRKAAKPQKPTGSYVFTRPDSTHYRVLRMPGDKSRKLGADKRFVKPFDLSQVKNQYHTSKRRPHPELTVTDLKSIAAQYQITFLAICNPSLPMEFQYNTAPFLDMVKKLETARVQPNYVGIGVVLVSVSYDLQQLDKMLTQNLFPYQSFVMPARTYSEKTLLKNIFFTKELCPECWQREKDYVSDYKIFMLDQNGKVMDKLAAPGDQKFYADELNRMADYAIETDRLLKTAK